MKSDTEKVIEALVRHGTYPNTQTAMIRDGEYWLKYSFGFVRNERWTINYGYWRNSRTSPNKDGNGNKVRGCFKELKKFGVWIVWKETIIKQPRKLQPGVYSRTQFGTAADMKMAHELSFERRKR